jgi:radical SAM superfamily enzyme YgiQ (UPF0313 family)
MPRLELIYPSRTKENFNTELLYSPLALAYLARHTPAHFDIGLQDEYVSDDVDPQRLRADLAAFSPITPGITRAYRLADDLRARGITCVAGGAHVSALPDEALAHFDAVVVGEGEGPWRRLVADFEAGKLEGVYEGRMDVSLEDLGTPMREHIHPRYRSPSVMTSRGCPYACSFCYLNSFPHRRYRTIPHDTVIEDLDSIRTSPQVIVTDENFIGYDETDFEDRKVLLERMVRRGYDFVWGCQTTVNVAYQPELLDLMYRSGCRAVFVGFESVDRSGLEEINKRQNYEVDYHDIIRRIHDHKIAVIASCILGLDSHEPGYHKELIRSLKETQADFPRVFFMTAWPGTPLFEKLEKEDRACRDWDAVRKDMPSIRFKNYTHEEILAARKEVMDAFFSPVNVTRVLGRWVLKDRSLLTFFLKKAVKNRIVERVRQVRNTARLLRTGNVRAVMSR